jgi:hypothetical protein
VSSEEELESQYDEEDGWEEKGFLQGMEEADTEKKTRKSLFPDDIDEMDEEFGKKFSDEEG